jgi:anti-sigma regulatory factor (Ser/Thr protein kinase)
MTEKRADEVNKTTDKEMNESIAPPYRSTAKDPSAAAHISESPPDDSGKNSDTEKKGDVISITVPANNGSLTKLTEWLDGVLRGYRCPEAVSNQVMLANEEIFVNIASYAYPAPGGEVTARIAKKGNLLALRYEDEGVPFNPLETPEPETNMPPEDRKIGGLGIFLVRKMMDNVKYERVNDKNRLTLYKTLS